MIHAFNASGLAALDPQWAGGRPRRISDDDDRRSSSRRPPPARRSVGRPFTHWSLRKLAAYLARQLRSAVVRLGRERLRQILREHQITLPADPDLEGVHRSGQGRQARPDRGRDQPLPDALFRVRPVRAAVDPAVSRLGWAPESSTGPVARDLSPHPRRPLLPRLLQPRRRPAVGCHPAPQRRRVPPSSALKSIRAARPDGAPIYVIMDNLSANKTPADPGLGGAQQGRVVSDPDLGVVGEPDPR